MVVLLLVTTLMSRPGQVSSLPRSGSSPAAAAAATYTVSSLSELRTRIAGAQPGDTIILANGSYNNTGGAILIDRQGSSSQPITIAAQTIGGAVISGSSGFTFSSRAAYIVLRGFRFTHSAGTIELPAGSHHCRILRNEIRLAVSGKANFMTVAGDDHEIAYNTFREKSSEGQMLTINGPGSTGMAQRSWIHHNYFLNFYPTGLNNAGALHIGHSGRSLTAAHAIVEYNLFVNTRGENEGSITSKVSDVTYRYNTFGTNAEELSLRHGNRIQVYGNFFVGSIGGLRIFGDEHRIYNNYFEGNAKAIHVGNGDCTIPPGELTCHDRPDNVHISFNTLVNNSKNIFMSSRSSGRGATGLVVANNIIQGGPQAGDFDGPLSGTTWQGNIIWNTSAGNLQGHTTLNPQLVEDSSSAYRLSASSPAIDRAAGTYSYVAVDMDLQTRSGSKDTGADEYSTAAVRNRILTASNVGPNADLSPTPTPTSVISPSPTRTRTATGAPPTRTSTATTLPIACVTATAGGPWVNQAFSSQSGSFSVSFDARTSAKPTNSVVGLSLNAASAYTSVAANIRFNASGMIDARNGGAFAAASSIPYSANTSYRFRLVVNVPAHTYTIFVSAPGGSEQLVGSNYAFRSEQASITSLNNLTAYVNAAATGTTSVCNVVVAPA